MKTFDDLEFKQHPAAETAERAGYSPPFLTQAKLTFDNGFGVSVVTGECAYGEWELAVTIDDDGLHFSNPVTPGGPEGCVTESEVTALMAQVQAFTAGQEWPEYD